MEEFVDPQATSNNNEGPGYYYMSDEEDRDGQPAMAIMSAATMKQILDIPRESKPRAPKKLKHTWKNDGEYELIRPGVVLKAHPDEYGEQLQERTMAIFKNKDPSVTLCGDPDRPLWRGVFVMAPEFGYGEDEYYNPKQSHYKIMYRPHAKGGLPKDNLVEPPKKTDGENDEEAEAAAPADNLVHLRTGVKLPYWVDAYYRLKQSETRSRQLDRKRKDETGTAGTGKKKKGVGGASSKKRERVGDPVVAIDNVYIFSLSPAAEEHEEGDKKGTVTFTSCMLKSNPSERLNTELSDIFAVLDGGKDAQLRPIIPLSTAASGSKSASKKKKKVVTFDPAVLVPATVPVAPATPSVVVAAAVPLQSSGTPQVDLMYLKRRRGEYNAHQIAQYDAGNRTGTYQLMMSAGLDPDDVLIDFCKFLCAK